MRRLPFTEADFEEWRTSTVTRAVFMAFEALAKEAKAEWLALSWGEGKCDPVMLADLRARAQTAEDLVSVDFATIEKRLITEEDHEDSNSQE